MKNIAATSGASEPIEICGRLDQPCRACHLKRLALSALIILMSSAAGCVMPLPHKVEFGRKFEASDITFVDIGITARAEITERFGVPDKAYVEPPVSVYWWWERVGVYVIAEPFCGAGEADTIHRTGLLLVLFEGDQVKKVQIRYAPWSGVTEQFIAKWSSAK